MLYNRTIDRLLILTVPAALFVYASTRSHVRLRFEMPKDFVDVQATANSAQRAKEEHLAAQYWDCALTSIQWKYTYRSPLPDNPPEEFRVNTIVSPGSEPAQSSRLRYWKRLRRVWLLPSAWKTTHEWSTDWLIKPLKEVLTDIEYFFKDLFRT